MLNSCDSEVSVDSVVCLQVPRLAVEGLCKTARRPDGFRDLRAVERGFLRSPTTLSSLCCMKCLAQSWHTQPRVSSQADPKLCLREVFSAFQGGLRAPQEHLDSSLRFMSGFVSTRADRGFLEITHNSASLLPGLRHLYGKGHRGFLRSPTTLMVCLLCRALRPGTTSLLSCKASPRHNLFFVIQGLAPT